LRAFVVCSGNLRERRTAWWGWEDGGKLKLGPISKQGDRYLRRLLVVGAVSTLRRAKQNPQKFPWITRLLARRPFKVVAVALANKMARIAWALLISDKTCRSAWFAAA
jgi:transposase